MKILTHLSCCSIIDKHSNAIKSLMFSADCYAMTLLDIKKVTEDFKESILFKTNVLIKCSKKKDILKKDL